jgi:Transposase DDE domain
LHARLVASGPRGVRVRRLGGSRAGEIRITRFLRNRAVTTAEMVAVAAARTGARLTGRHVLAIQDTTTVRSEAEGRSIALHPVIAVDALEGTLLGLIDAAFFVRDGGQRAQRQTRGFAEKESRRWLEAAERAAGLGASAAQITVVADREGDIYEDFACKPRAVEVLIRAGQDRALSDGTRLFAKAATLAEAGRMSVELAAAPGRRARTATLALRFCRLAIARPVSRTHGTELAALPASVDLTLVEAREVDPPTDGTAAHWRLLTTHGVADAADARRIVGFYRQRWTIEQLFRTLKTHGFDVEALRLAEGGPFEKLVAASLIAAVTVLQLVRERAGTARRPLADAFDPEDQPVLERLSASLEGKTARQKNPHPKRSLAFAAWVIARLGGWTGYYGKPGPAVMLHGLLQFHAIKHGWTLHNV